MAEKNTNFTRAIFTERHDLLADERKDIGGAGQGPNSNDLLLASFGACTSMIIRMYANRKSALREC